MKTIEGKNNVAITGATTVTGLDGTNTVAVDLNAKGTSSFDILAPKGTKTGDTSGGKKGGGGGGGGAKKSY